MHPKRSPTFHFEERNGTWYEGRADPLTYPLHAPQAPPGSAAQQGTSTKWGEMTERPEASLLTATAWKQPGQPRAMGSSCLCGASVGFLTRYDGEIREPLVQRHRSWQKLKLLLLISHLSRLREPRLYECRGSVRAGTVGGPGHREDVPCLGGLESSTEDRRTRSVTTVGSGSLSCGPREVRSPCAWPLQPKMEKLYTVSKNKTGS